MNILEQNKEAVIAMAQNGLLHRDIAMAYNMSVSSVGRFLRSNGITYKIDITDEMVREIIALYQNGKTIEDICKLVGIGFKRVSKVLHSHNVLFRQPSDMNRRYAVNEFYFDILENQNQIYIIGLLYADGCNTDRHQIKLSLQESDVGLLRMVNQEIGGNRPLRFIDYQHKNTRWANQYELVICNKHMSTRLRELGVLPRKSLVLTYPDWLREWMIPHFIRGYLDGDGCIHRTEKRVSIIGTTSVCDGVKSAVENILGIHCSLSFPHGHTSTNTVDLRISGATQVKKFLDYIYKDANIYMQRKYDLYKQLYD